MRLYAHPLKRGKHRKGEQGRFYRPFFVDCFGQMETPKTGGDNRTAGNKR